MVNALHSGITNINDTMNIPFQSQIQYYVCQIHLNLQHYILMVSNARI